MRLSLSFCGQGKVVASSKLVDSCHLTGCSGVLAKKPTSTFAVFVVQSRHHLQQIEVHLVCELAVFLVLGVLGHETPDEVGASGNLARGSVRQELQVMHNLLNFVLRPLFDCHILLAQREQALVEADALVSVQDLPDVELLVASLISSLILFRICCSGLFLIRLDKSTLSKWRLTIGGSLANGWHFPPEFSVQQAFAIVSTLHILIDERNGEDEVGVKGVDHVGNHADCDGKGGVLEVSQLDVHGSELYTPSDLGVFSWRIFES